MTTTKEAIEILLVEDNPADVRLVREALRYSSSPYRLNVAPDGVEALAYLRAQGTYAQRASPDLVLLDLNLPRKDGRQVLAEMKGDEALARIPVVVLSTSQADDDVAKAYELHANCYVSKPVDLDAFIARMHSVEQFWLTVVRLPTRPQDG